MLLFFFIGIPTVIMDTQPAQPLSHSLSDSQSVTLSLAQPLKSQVVLLQTAHSWANAGVLLGARMHRERVAFETIKVSG